MNGKAVILMSAYNGEKYLREQLNSLLNQQDTDFSIEIRDDGSSDGTWDILCEFEKNYPNINITKGENLGYAKSFWTLLSNARKSDYYAFCDQDDVWDSDKLKAAINALENENADIPLLYFSDVRVTDEKLNVISENMVEEMPISYAHSLIKNIAPGCTYVFNDKARELLKKYDCDKYGIDIHDWNVYRIISCFGKVIFDKNTYMSYRQHGNNAIGAGKKSLFAQLISAARRLLSGKTKNIRETSARRLETVYGEMMSAENLYITRLAAHYREDKKIKSELLKCGAFKFGGIKYLYFRMLLFWNYF